MELPRVKKINDSRPTKKSTSTEQALKRRHRTEGKNIVWPFGVCERYGVSAVTRWRMENDGRLPPRDAFIGGKAVGWRPETLDAAERGQRVAA
jgi:predicted DNA-binding transcriptional regulator AlpA